ncbi:hypothetical protein SLS53_003185 [Cytospora paraplurivora]|uniref:Uncharacterized protein n=1 Tax=Cytospora paraplurivora TaxID=2898453 RepID=A0AAN9UBY6_9PEZI
MCNPFTPNGWPSDESVNGTLLHLARYVNQKAVIENTRLQTAKVQVLNSFSGQKIREDSGPVKPKNLVLSRT